MVSLPLGTLSSGFSFVRCDLGLSSFVGGGLSSFVGGSSAPGDGGPEGPPGGGGSASVKFAAGVLSGGVYLTGRTCLIAMAETLR